MFGGKLVSFDEAKIAGMPGVKKVVKVKDTARRGRRRHLVARQDGARCAADRLGRGRRRRRSPARPSPSTSRRASPRPTPYGERNDGDALKAIAGAAKKVEAVYSTPFLAHATMEPMNCTVKLSADKAEVWVPTQNAEASLAALSEAVGRAARQCEVYRHDLGGGFGRRGGTQDYVHQAVAIAKEFPGVPVKLIWSREEDQAHDFYRPISQCKLAAGLDADGKLVGLHVRVSGQSINAYAQPAAVDRTARTGASCRASATEPGDAQLGYTVPNLLIEYAMRNTHVPVGPWRGVNTNQNAVYMECFIEEVARAAGKDPLEFRRALMSKHPKHLAVLNAAAEKGDWGKPLPAGVHRGIAQFMGYGSYSAAVAEVSVSATGQAEGASHGARAQLRPRGQSRARSRRRSRARSPTASPPRSTARCTVENGRMTELNFDSYEIMRLAEMPKVETVIVPTYDFWGGVGEPTICVVAPARAQRDPRRDRQAGAQPAAEEREAGLSAGVPSSEGTPGRRPQLRSVVVVDVGNPCGKPRTGRAIGADAADQQHRVVTAGRQHRGVDAVLRQHAVDAEVAGRVERGGRRVEQAGGGVGRAAGQRGGDLRHRTGCADHVAAGQQQARAAREDVTAVADRGIEPAQHPGAAAGVDAAHDVDHVDAAGAGERIGADRAFELDQRPGVGVRECSRQGERRERDATTEVTHR